VLLVACGGGNSNSSSGFAPKNAEAFETKFVNQIMTLSSGTVAVVLLGKRQGYFPYNFNLLILVAIIMKKSIYFYVNASTRVDLGKSFMG
jgi:hypothetical protein